MKSKKLVKAFARQLAMEFIEAERKRSPVTRPKAKAPSAAAVKAAADRALKAKAVQPPSGHVKAAADHAERKPIVISAEMVERSKQKSSRFTRVNPFALPSFPTAVTDHVPADRRMAADESINQISAWSGGAWNSLGANVAFEGIAFLGYQYLAELSQRPEYRVIVETIATEMTRKWIRLQGKGDKDKTKKIDQLNEELERLKVREMFCRACELDGYFGRSHLYFDTGHTDDRDELKTPIGNGLNRISDVKFNKGDLKRLAVVEPMWTYPTSYNSNNPLRPDWYNPQQWFVMDREVHVSRLLKFVGHPVPDALKPAYSFGGLSMTQMAKPYVENFLNIRQSVADIVQAFSVFVLGTNLGETLTPGGDEIFRRADLFNNTRDNRGLMIIDKDTEEFQNVAAPLSGLDQLQAQAQEHMASVSRIPLVKLLGISPHGLNATAEPELRAFYDHIGAKQRQFFAPNLDIVLRFAQLNIWSKVDPDITYEFEPLWSLDEKAAAEVRKTNAETAQISIDSGVLAPEEERVRIANDPDTLYHGLDPNNVPDLLEEEQEGLEPKGGAARIAEGGASEPYSGEAEDSNWNEEDHPRAGNGQFGTGGSSNETDAAAKRGSEAMEKAITEQHDVFGAMERPELGAIDFRWGDNAGGVAHIIAKHGAEAARKMPEVIARGSLKATITGRGRPRVLIEHEGWVAALSPEYQGKAGHWLVTGFEKTKE